MLAELIKSHARLKGLPALCKDPGQQHSPSGPRPCGGGRAVGNAGPSPGPPAPSAGLPGPACHRQFPSQAGPAAAEMPRKVALVSCWHQGLSTPGDSGDPCACFQGPPSFSRSFPSPWPGPSQMPAALDVQLLGDQARASVCLRKPSGTGIWEDVSTQVGPTPRWMRKVPGGAQGLALLTSRRMQALQAPRLHLENHPS